MPFFFIIFYFEIYSTFDSNILWVYIHNIDKLIKRKGGDMHAIKR